MKRVLFLGFALAIFLSAGAYAQSQEFTHVISNSDNWRDVYSTIHYANLQGKGSDFLVSTRHGPLLLTGVNRENDIRVVSSRRNAFVINYPSTIRNAGFRSGHEIVVGDANLELIDDLPNIRDFIIVGNLYGYNGIAVAPYAVKSESWVFFADRSNIAQIDSILSNRQVDNVIIYGLVDKEVRAALQKHRPETINTGDRFNDNIGITKKYLEINPVNQVVFTNGEFIERGIMDGNNPVLFTGRDNVPPQIANYLKTSPFEVGVLIGSDLVNTATNIRRDTGISVIVRFARSARNPTGAVAQVEGLDLFYLSTPVMSLSLHSVKYNAANSQLQVTYKSESNTPVYFRGTITPIIDGERMSIIGDEEPIFIAPNDYKTVIYGDFQVPGENLVAGVYTLYGETPTSLERILEATMNVEFVNVIDGCEIDILKVTYRMPRDAFHIRIENIGNTECWVSTEIDDLILGGLRTTVGSEGSVIVPAGKKRNVVIKEILDREDLENNPLVNVIAYYGETEDGLVKVIQRRVELRIERFSKLTIGLAVLALLVIIVIIFLIWKRRKEDDF
jgi:hypothetical protein